jgi:CRP-like cAMP-binding protein
MPGTEELRAALQVVAVHGWYARRAPPARTAIAAHARLRDYAAGEALYHYGDAPNGIFGLVSGALDIAIPRADGSVITVHRADTGFWIGDLALFSGQTRLVSVIAAEPTRVVHLSSHDLRRLVGETPALYGDFYELTHENMATALSLLANLATTPSEARVAVRLLLLEAAQGGNGGELRLSQAKLAELVALSPPTLQRVLRRLQNDGLIELGYGRIRITDRPGLLSLCGGADAADGSS